MGNYGLERVPRTDHGSAAPIYGRTMTISDRDADTLADAFDERDPAVTEYQRELIPRAPEASATDTNGVNHV